MSRQNKVFVAIIIFTIIQIGILLIFGYTPYHDSDCYISAAEEAIMDGQLYPSTSQIVHNGFIWNIGAIDVIQLSLYIFGSTFPILILYSILKGATAWLFYKVTKSLTTHTVAIIALVVYFLYPANYGESTSLLSEIPFIFFVFTAIYFAICRDNFFVSGLFLALANTFRPLAILFIIAIVIYAISKGKNIIRHSSWIIIAYVVSILFIGSISYARTGKFFYQATTGWYNFIQSNEFDNNIDLQLNEKRILGKNSRLDCMEKNKIWRKRAIEWIISNPKEYISKMGHTFIYTYISDNTTMCTFVPDKDVREDMYSEVSMRTLIKVHPNYSKVQILTIINLVYYYLLLLLFVLSIRCLFKNNKPMWYLCISVIVFGSLMLVLFSHAETRYHIPFMPFIIMMVSYFLYANFSRFSIYLSKGKAI